MAQQKSVVELIEQDNRADETDYERLAEEMALRKLLKNKHFKHAVDVGGGYGRLCLFLQQFADRVTLVEPDPAKIELARQFLKGQAAIKRLKKPAEKLGLAKGSVDLITMIRVMHHVPEPATAFKEFHKVLNADGYLLLELGNYGHGRNRLKHLLRGKRLPAEPVRLTSATPRRDQSLPFVYHNPKTVIKQLAHAGFKVEKVLSVSNLRSPGLKKIMPRFLMLAAESILQSPFSRIYFGPSVFLLARKAA